MKINVSYNGQQQQILTNDKPFNQFVTEANAKFGVNGHVLYFNSMEFEH
jgi:hypothetical protein